jgi:hypothetical protein
MALPVILSAEPSEPAGVAVPKDLGPSAFGGVIVWTGLHANKSILR